MRVTSRRLRPRHSGIVPRYETQTALLETPLFLRPFVDLTFALLNDVTVKIPDRDGIDVKSRLPFYIPERIDSLNFVIGARMLVRNTRYVKTLTIAY